MIERIQNLWQEVLDLTLGPPPHIDRFPSPHTPLQFLRRYVSPNKPCLISPYGPPPSTFAKPSPTPPSPPPHPHREIRRSRPHPSAPSSLCFAPAHVEKLLFSEALDLIMVSDENNNKTVAYLQHQNDFFRGGYGSLVADCEEHVSWASDALGCSQEAVNLLIGNDLSETSFHKDHYENLYALITGHISEYPSTRYIFHQDSGEFELELEDPIRYTSWCSVDPYPSPNEKQNETKKFPLYFNGTSRLKLLLRLERCFSSFRSFFSVLECGFFPFVVKS